MLRAKRIGHATLTTSDLSKQIDYYTQILGLSVGHADDRSAVITTKMGQECLILNKGDSASATGLSFQVSPDTDLRDAASRLNQEGVASEIRSDVTPGVKRMLSFKDPNGTSIGIFAESSFSNEDKTPAAFIPHKLGHVAFNTADISKVVEFYERVLGFRVSDSREGWFVFMRCGRDHHTANFVETGQTHLHHIAFELRDEADINRACDHLARMGLKVFWGPVRHVIGHNIAAYHHNPDGLTIELFTDLDVMADEELGYFEPKPWHQDRPQRPKVWSNDTPTNCWGWERPRVDR